MFDYDDDEIKEKVNPKRHVCPVCGKHELAFTSAPSANATGFRFLKLVFIAFLAFALLTWIDGYFEEISEASVSKPATVELNIEQTNAVTPPVNMPDPNDDNLDNVYVLLSVTLIFYALEIIAQGKTRIKALCKDCGHIWFIT